VHDLGVIDLIARVVLSALVGALVGYERERRSQSAGARTHSLAAVGAAAFTIVGGYGFDDAAAAGADPTRVAAQVATGIGFIGAGAILRQGSSVRGLTTAATLWLVAAVGVAAGAGMYLLVVTTGIVAFVILIPPHLRPTHPYTLEIEYDRGHGTLGPLLHELRESAGEHVELVDIEDDEDTPRRLVSFRVHLRKPGELSEAIEALRDRPEVRRVELF
jgi:putative Mg2+ transporter-C (MgtC) family protein